MNYQNWLEEWLAIYVKPLMKERTYEKYRRIADRQIIPALGHYEMDALNGILLQKFVVGLSGCGYAPNTVNGVVGVLNNSLRRAESCKVIPLSPSERLVRPKAKEKRVECFSVAEQRRMETYIRERKKPKLFGIILCLYTGLRIGELMALTWDDVDLEKGMISVTKSCHDGSSGGRYKRVTEEPKTENSTRMIPIARQLIRELKRLKKELGGTYVVTNGKKELSVRSYQRTFELLLKRLEIPHRGFHALRHTFATRALECGMDVKTLSELLGHKNPAVTLKRYVHSMVEHKTEMINKLGKYMQ